MCHRNWANPTTHHCSTNMSHDEECGKRMHAAEVENFKEAYAKVKWGLSFRKILCLSVSFTKILCHMCAVCYTASSTL